MSDGVLITFGCSWAFGLGVGFHHSMTAEEYRKIAQNTDICDEYSFRGLLSKRFNLKNINFSCRGSSNQRQFRLLKEFFISPEFEKIREEYSKIIVLHCITTTTRNEMFMIEHNELVNFNYGNDNKNGLCKAIIKYSYDHNNELARLATEMNFCNKFYQAMNIKNLWVDTVNHHEYPAKIDNLINENTSHRDLLSNMAIRNGFINVDNEYAWNYTTMDSPRIKYLRELGYLNTICNHPTKKGHKLIADILENHLGKIL
jgi:hypothetical protein